MDSNEITQIVNANTPAVIAKMKPLRNKMEVTFSSPFSDKPPISKKINDKYINDNWMITNTLLIFILRPR